MSFAPGRPGLLTSLAGVAARIKDHRKRAGALRSLRGMDDATLRDIGMSRGELTSICFGDAAGRRNGHG
jgi:uncharacterized protein YjiS (DUF1127 family)